MKYLAMVLIVIGWAGCTTVTIDECVTTTDLFGRQQRVCPKGQFSNKDLFTDKHGND